MTQNTMTLEDIERLGELLATIPEPFVPMEADMLDGYLTAIALMKAPPSIEDWIGFVFDVENRNRARLPEPRQSELRKLILRRGAVLEQAILSQKAIDPIVYEEEEEGAGENELSALSAFSDGFAFACSTWPELLKNEDKAVQAALVGVLRYETRNEEEQTEDEDAVIDSIEEEVPFMNLDEALADLEACVQEIAEVTRANDIARQRTPKKSFSKKRH